MAITETIGNITIFDTPPAVVTFPGVTPSNNIQGFTEQQGLLLQSNLQTDDPNFWDQPSSTVVPAGTAVNSYYFYLAPVSDKRLRVEVDITFSDQIVGLFGSTTSLISTNTVLGASGVGYATTIGLDNNLEFPTIDDTATILSDGKTLRLSISTDKNLDAIRVLTRGQEGIPQDGSGGGFNIFPPGEEETDTGNPATDPDASPDNTSCELIVLRGTKRNDRIKGEEGCEKIRGLKGNDRLIGKGGDDILIGNAGDDRLKGGDGDDLIKSGKGGDRSIGGKGDDVMFANGPGNKWDLLKGGAGIDEYVLKGRSRARITFDEGDIITVKGVRSNQIDLQDDGRHTLIINEKTEDVIAKVLRTSVSEVRDALS